MRYIALAWAWQAASVATFLWLMVTDWPGLTWWNWVFLVPINLALGEIWPIYWGFLHWVMG